MKIGLFNDYRRQRILDISYLIYNFTPLNTIHNL